MGYPNRAQKTDRAGNPPTSNTLLQMMGGSHGWWTGATPVSRPGEASGSTLIGKNQTQFAADNPNQLSAGLPLNNPALNAIDGNIRQPVSLTVTGGNHAYNNPAWGLGLGSIFNPAWGRNPSINAPWTPQGADPGMGGLPGYGTTQMAPGIAPQGPPPPGIEPTVWAGDIAPKHPSAGGYSLAKRPGLPMSGQVGFSHNGSSNGPAAYTSGVYLFDKNCAQNWRDPHFAGHVSYAGTPQAVASAQRRDRLTQARNGAFSSNYGGQQDGERWGQ
jgi:hypothetical protein